LGEGQLSAFSSIKHLKRGKRDIFKVSFAPIDRNEAELWAGCEHFKVAKTLLSFIEKRKNIFLSSLSPMNGEKVDIERLNFFLLLYSGLESFSE
jgi:hypothetical protein